METEETAKLREQMMNYQEDVFRVCLGFSRNPWDAEDLSQEVYLKAIRKIGMVHEPGALRAWLLRIARNTCLDHQKKGRLFRLFQRSVTPGDARGASDQHDHAQARERLAKLKEAVRRLPGKQQEVFVLREYGHLSYSELAKTLGLKQGTVMSRLNRARKAVLGFMREGNDE
ncbi:MAG: RNA polymerase sigma factor [Candidatus Aminicenantes bacterium]|nr:RNA polymerase sigma factor [Candidatus Aminicenantes bacterium]